MNMTESTRKYIFLGFVGFIIIGIIAAKIMGGTQDEDYALVEEMYNYAIDLYAEGNLEESLTYLQVVAEEQPRSEAVHYALGLIGNEGESYGLAANSMDKVLEVNPHNVEDADFMLSYGQVLTDAEQYEEATIVFQYIRDHALYGVEAPEQNAEIVQMYLDILETE